MQLEFYRTLWGNQESLDTYLPKLAERGYHGIETSLLFHSDEEKELFLTLPNLNLKIILLILTFGESVQDHIDSLTNQLALTGPYNPVKVNVHGGCDKWTLEETCEYFNAVMKLQETYNHLSIIHETHRGRILFNPWVTQKVLETYPNLYITADLSHWVVVSERHLLPEFSKSMELVYQRTKHIHARPSTPQFIQLSDINDPFFKEDLDNFKVYWFNILQYANDHGVKLMTIDPEFGPSPYSLVKSNSSGEMIRNLEDCADDIVKLFDEMLKNLK
ncbi:hypothetical protein BC833DRAFT_600836 [Globomyces pollinis-pini]|nr:hypothetical protein BC833DRAFT_600836 [Globomyces pollinis-pini]KAJ2995789.1 hypothetical protein HDV02_000476 [Globomyces sp. JEL0801]